MTLRTLLVGQYRVMEGSAEGFQDDAALITRAREEPEAFAELYRRHMDAVVRFAARRADRPDAVVDLVAAVWLEVLASLDRFDPRRGRVLPWILGIAANLCASERRRRAREREALRRLGGRRPLAEDDYHRLELRIDAEATAARLSRVIRGLPVAERLAAEFVLVEGMSPGDAAAALGISEPAVRMRLTRARRKLRAAFEAKPRGGPRPITEEACR
jgi:RNA polymerase sigma factor (sigma-70 family)